VSDGSARKLTPRSTRFISIIPWKRRWRHEAIE
jgi:hypothetical protein